MIFNNFSFRIFVSALLVTATFCFGQQANVNLDYNPQKDTEGLIPFSARVNSPEVHDDQTVTFRLMAPDAQKVELNPGAINTALGKGGEANSLCERGRWSLDIDHWSTSA